jgi:hypothetical protein
MMRIKKNMIFDWLDELAEYKYMLYDNEDNRKTIEQTKLQLILKICDEYDFNIEKAFIDHNLHGKKFIDNVM